MALLRCHGDSDCNKTQIMRNFHLYIIQLWKPFFISLLMATQLMLKFGKYPPKKIQSSHLNKSNLSITLKSIQQNLAEYKFGQNTEFIYRTVLGTASNRSNILRNVSLQFTRIFYLPFNSQAFYTKQDSSALSFPQPLFDSRMFFRI